jgi:hypothetical protein
MIPDTARIKTHRAGKSGDRIVQAVHGLCTRWSRTHNSSWTWPRI